MNKYTFRVFCKYFWLPRWSHQSILKSCQKIQNICILLQTLQTNFIEKNSTSVQKTISRPAISINSRPVVVAFNPLFTVNRECSQSEHNSCCLIIEKVPLIMPISGWHAFYKCSSCGKNSEAVVAIYDTPQFCTKCFNMNYPHLQVK